MEQPTAAEPEVRTEVQAGSVEDVARHSTSDPLPNHGPVSDRSKEGRIHVYLTDDDLAIMREAARGLERVCPELKIMGTAHHAQLGKNMALGGVDKLDPDRGGVALLDIHMLGMTAFEACEKILKESGGKVQALFYTGYPSDINIQRAIAAGGLGVLNKHSASLEEVAEAIQAVAGGQKHYSPELWERVTEAETGKLKTPADLLTGRELYCLKRLCEGATNQEIADELDLGLRSIEKAVSDIKKPEKLNVPSTKEAMMWAAANDVVYPELSSLRTDGKSFDKYERDKQGREKTDASATNGNGHDQRGDQSLSVRQEEAAVAADRGLRT